MDFTIIVCESRVVNIGNSLVSTTLESEFMLIDYKIDYRLFIVYVVIYHLERLQDCLCLNVINVINVFFVKFSISQNFKNRKNILYYLFTCTKMFMRNMNLLNHK